MKPMANRSRSVELRPDAGSRVPRYLQVASVLRRRISDGFWPVGARIATLEELEKEFDVARVTVRPALRASTPNIRTPCGIPFSST